MNNIRHFKDVSYVKGHVRVNLHFGKYGARFARAQQWLGQQVLADCKPYMPLRTGSLQQRSYASEDGRRVVFPGPYARFLYMGKVMVDPETNSPYARKGVVKVATGRDLKLSAGVAHWAEMAEAEHGKEWAEGCKRIIKGETYG